MTPDLHILDPEVRSPRLGFLGLGWIGQKRLQAVAEAEIAEIALMADTCGDALEKLRAFAPHAATVMNWDNFAPLGLDGLVIATPSALHAEQSIAALEMSLPVFCQKPLGRNLEEVTRIVEAARVNDCLLGVDLSYRHLSGLKILKEMLADDILGDIFAVDLIFHNAYGPDKSWFYNYRLSGGGCVIDLGVHLIDALLWCLDTEIIGVDAGVFRQGRLCGKDAIEDYAHARLELENGTVANLSCSWGLHAGRDAIIEFRFYGTKGGFVVRNRDGSFTEFITEHLVGTKGRILAEGPEAWQEGAVLQWVKKLAETPQYDPAIERQLSVAAALDAIYRSSHSKI